MDGPTGADPGIFVRGAVLSKYFRVLSDISLTEF